MTNWNPADFEQDDGYDGPWNTCPIHGHYRQPGGIGECPTCEQMDAWCRAAGLLREGEILYYFGPDAGREDD